MRTADRRAYALLKFESQAYWQMLVSRGFAVLALNPVGSGSYGREFRERLRGRWGELDLPQQAKALRTLQEEGIADEHIAIVGKSYGGYIAGVGNGHLRLFSRRRRDRARGNLETHYGTSDGGYHADEYRCRQRPAARATSIEGCRRSTISAT